MSLRTPNFLRQLGKLIPHQRKQTCVQSRNSSSIPRIAQPSLWSSMVPRFLRRQPSTTEGDAPKKISSFRFFISNPATPLIFISILSGSQAIQLLTLKRDMAERRRRAEAKMDLLREVIERVQAGEDVDIAATLGTGNEAMEKEWIDALEQIGLQHATETKRERQTRRRLEKQETAVTAATAAGAAGATTRAAKDQNTKTKPGFY